MRPRSYFYAIAVCLASCAGLDLTAQAQAIKTQPVKTRVPALHVYQAIDARMQQIPDSSTTTVGGLVRYINASFSTESDKARAAFVWVANNLRYDTENMYVVSFADAPAVTVRQALANRIGVCADYAELYNAIITGAGLKSYVVTGYTRRPTGSLAPIGHAWCATRIAGQWYLMDPTWGAGYVVEETFVARLNNDHFKATPSSYILSHMPFDPLWQLLPEPSTTAQFQKGIAPTPTVQPFNFQDSIAVYERQTPIQRLQAVNRRIEQNGVKNALVFNYLSHNYASAYNEALNEFNEGVQKLNGFVEFYNRQFFPRKTDAELQALLPPIAAHFAHSRELLATVHIQDQAHQSSMKQFVESLQEAATKVQNSQAFMARYLQTGKLMRPTLFMNISSGRNEMMR